MEITLFRNPLYKSTVFLFICSLFVFSSCLKDKCKTTYTYVKYNPVYKSRDEIQKFEVLPAKTMSAIGKIWMYGKYLLINEPKTGIHVINNTNPASPQAIAFISIPGNVDMAVKSNILYADNYTDMLVIDFSDPAHPVLQKRLENIFSSFSGDGRGNILVDYEEETVTEVLETENCNTGGGGFNNDMGGGMRNTAEVMTAQSGSSGGSSAPSVGGSMARFTLYQNYLYVLNQNNLHPFDISSPVNPVKHSPVSTVFGAETLFPYKDKLFMGATTGMYIYDLAGNPAKPVHYSTFVHANSCDPVVVENDIAYVTLRNGTECNSISNQLDVIDVKDMRNPKLLKTYQMFNPHGLGIDNGTLFICDGADGLKVFDAADAYAIEDNKLGHYKNMDTYDVIPYNNNLILTTKNGIYQYDYSDRKNLKLLSRIAR